MSGKLTRIAAAMEHLGRTFRDAGLETPEVHVSHDDLYSLRGMSEARHLMCDPKLSEGPDQIGGVVIRVRSRQPA